MSNYHKMFKNYAKNKVSIFLLDTLDKDINSFSMRVRWFVLDSEFSAVHQLCAENGILGIFQNC